MRARKLTAQEKFFRAVDDIAGSVQQPVRNDASFWFMEYMEAEARATKAETELAALRAQIAAGQLVDRSMIPQNRTLTISERFY